MGIGFFFTPRERKNMRKTFVFLLLLLFFPMKVFSLGDTDNRYYVSNEMWATEPYNKYVFLEIGFEYTYKRWERINETDKDLTEITEDIFVPIGKCTAQFVAQNLLLSAGHCIFTKKNLNDILKQYPYENARVAYRGMNYNKEKFDVKLVDTEYTGKAFDTLGDWAVWLVTDSKYYSDTYFDIHVPTKTVDVINAGWGSLRIFSDAELDAVRRVYNKILDRINEENAKIDDENKKKDDSLKAAIKEISETLGVTLLDDPYNLKASECKIVFEDCKTIYSEISSVRDKLENTSDNRRERLEKQKNKQEEKFNKLCNNQQALKRESLYPYILATTCDAYTGNSGGGLISMKGKDLYGTISYGLHALTDERNTEYIVSAKQFEKRLRGLIKTYNARNPIEENLSKIPERLYGDDDSTDKKPIENKALSALDILDTRDIRDNLISQLSNIPNMSNEQLVDFLNNLAEYQDKTERQEKLQKAYEEAKANEQSLANRTLSALTVAATGIGGMELAMGLAEQKADKEAEASMTAYIETMRCTYGDGKQVKAGPTEIELPGGNNAELMKLRSEYFALAKDLKERKEALGMKAGIESEEILDKSQTGLYDDDNIGINSGAYESLYRAKMLESENDQAKIDENADASKKRVIGGGVAAGAGVIGGTVGNAIINRKSDEQK